MGSEMCIRDSVYIHKICKTYYFYLIKSDKNPIKVNLSVGVYQDDNGKTPTFESVTLAEKKLIEVNSSKTYKPIDGDSIFLSETLKLVLGESLYSKFASNTLGFNTPGGTGALKLASDFLYNFSSKSKVWLSNPTWPNHGPVFNSSGFEIKNYDYFDKNNNKIDFNYISSLYTLFSAPGVP